MYTFNQKHFRQLAGRYIREHRIKSKCTIREYAAKMDREVAEYCMIESGQKYLEQEEWEKIWTQLDLDLEELHNLGKIVSVRYLLEVYREIDEESAVQ